MSQVTPETSRITQPPNPTTAVPRKTSRFHMFLLSALLFMIAALVLACWWPLKYTTVARLERRADSASPDSSTAFESLKLTLEHELIGKNAVEIAVDRLEKEKLIPPLPRARDGKLMPDGQMVKQELVRGLTAGLRVWFDVRSPQVDLVSVTFTDRDPVLAKELPNILVTSYIDRTSEQIISNLTESHHFLRTKVAEAEARFAELIRKRIDFEVRYVGMLPDNPGALQMEIEKVRSDLDRVRLQQSLAKQKLDLIKAVTIRSAAPEGGAAMGKPEETPAETQGDAETAEVAALKKQLRETQGQLADARKRVVELEARVKEPASAPVVRTPTETTLDLYTQREVMYESEYLTAGREVERLGARLGKLTDVMSNYEPLRQGYLKLTRDLAAQQAEVDLWVKRLVEVQMSLAAEAAKHRTHLTQVELAQEQFVPSAPKLSYVLAFAFVGGLVFSAGLLFLNWLVGRISARWKCLRGIHAVFNDTAIAGRLMRRVLCSVGYLVLLVALFLATLNITLRLEYPEAHREWKSAPVSFLWNRVAEVVPQDLM